MCNVRLVLCDRLPTHTLFECTPELQTIWKPELSALAALHTKAWETDPRESGEVLIAKIEDTVIGVSGWYQMSSTEGGLRWHGVLPKHRKKGYSKQIIELVCNRLPASIQKVYEITRNPLSKDSFCRCGFAEVPSTNMTEIEKAVRHAEFDISEGGWVLYRTIS